MHRLGELGAVVTQTLKGTSQEGLDAEWRTIEIFTVEGDLLSRCEAFDETDLDAAIARFDELQSTGAAPGKRGKPCPRAIPRRVLRPATGTQ